MANSLRQPLAAALTGASCIASSAVLMRLAGSSASATALLRCAFALPALGGLVWWCRRRGTPPMPRRDRWRARLAGGFLAGDLVVWSHSISAVGAGLATVLGNLQVLFVAALAWYVLGERPKRSLLLALPVMLAGVAFVAGLAGSGSYGAHPALGAVLGVGVSLLYASYILLLRRAIPPAHRPGGGLGVVAQPLYEATLGAAATSLLLMLALRDFGLGHVWPALGWLALLALTSQVVGWLLITVSMPLVPAALVSALLLVQPAGAVALGAVILGERPSVLQLAGVALILLGVLIAARGAAPRPSVPPGAGSPDHAVSTGRTPATGPASASPVEITPST
jgi:drug/metabolite transporter (DMT)-like permease